MSLMPLLRLARVSNLPTIWSNVLAASVLAGGLGALDLALVLVAMSALYTSGMILNDAFDRDIDARDRPERPIPAGEISMAAVWGIGLAFMGAGVGLLATFGLDAAVAAAALAFCIVLYDAWHKGNPLSPVIMGACRALVYIGTAVAAGAALSLPIVAAALALLAYVAGLTFAAKGGAFRSVATSWPAALLALPVGVALITGETNLATLVFAAVALGAVAWAIARLSSGRPADRETAIGVLIASMALMDAVVASAHGSLICAFVCLALFVVTLAAQRVISGT